MVCPKCGRELPSGAAQCPQCGMWLQTQQYQQPAPAKRELNVGMLVWSILVMVFGILPCFIGFILGLIALIMTVLAPSSAADTEEQSKIRCAKILNIIGTAFLALMLLIFIVSGFLPFMMLFNLS